MIRRVALIEAVHQRARTQGCEMGGGKDVVDLLELAPWQIVIEVGKSAVRSVMR